MPNASEHQDKCNHNRTFLNSGLVASNPCWAATVAFYVAVHLVEKLATLNRTPPSHHTSHNKRELWLSRHPRHRVIFNEYETLRDASQTSRYHTLHRFNSMFPSSVVQAQLIDNCLVTIEKYVAQVFTPPSPPATPSAASGS